MLSKYTKQDRRFSRQSIDTQLNDQPCPEPTSVSNSSTHNSGLFQLSSHSPTRRVWDDAVKRNVHIRQNFPGKEQLGGYIPPHMSSSSNIQSRRSFDTRRLEDPSMPPYDEMAEDSELPFDMINAITSRPGAESQKSVISNQEAPTVHRKTEISFECARESSLRKSVAETGTFHQQISPGFFLKSPRYSEPSLPRRTRRGEELSSQTDNVERSGDNHCSQEIHTSNPEYSQVELPNRRETQTTARDETIYNDLMWKGEDVQLGGGESPVDEEGSSVFDFGMQISEEPKKAVESVLKISKSSADIEDSSEGEADETSLEIAKPKRRSPSSLQERTQQAWRSRQRKSSNLRSKQDPQAPRQANNVSFRHDDTVQYFDPHIDEATDDTGYSFDEKSLNSEYTKTLESEVEDMIKDILFIGNGSTSQPGRRQYRYKHEVKKRLRKIDPETRRVNGRDAQKGKDDLAVLSENKREGKSSVEVTVVCNGDEKYHADSTHEKEDIGGGGNKVKRAPKSTKRLNDLSETEAALWQFVDSGFTAMTSALGLTSKRSNVDSSVNDGFEEAASRDDGDACTESGFPFGTCTGRLTPEVVNAPKPARRGIFDHTQEAMYGPMLSETNRSVNNSGSKDSSRDDEQNLTQGSSQESRPSVAMFKEVSNDTSRDSTGEIVEMDNFPFSMDELDKDPRLVQLALHAARSLHQTQGVEFDASYQICMHSDLQISVVELRLPLGLIFLENDGGCFVTKVSPNGSAARSGGVDVGDQLAAINGGSSIRMKVDDICDMISKSPDPNCVELVFLRYIGPFRPSRQPQLEDAERSYEFAMNGTPHNSFHAKAPSSSGTTTQKESETKRRRFRFFGRGRNRAGSK